jgi:hypothetical protein
VGNNLRVSLAPVFSLLDKLGIPPGRMVLLMPYIDDGPLAVAGAGVSTSGLLQNGGDTSLCFDD